MIDVFSWIVKNCFIDFRLSFDIHIFLCLPNFRYHVIYLPIPQSLLFVIELLISPYNNATVTSVFFVSMPYYFKQGPLGGLWIPAGKKASTLNTYFSTQFLHSSCISTGSKYWKKSEIKRHIFAFQFSFLIRNSIGNSGQCLLRTLYSHH